MKRVELYHTSEFAESANACRVRCAAQQIDVALHCVPALPGANDYALWLDHDGLALLCPDNATPFRLRAEMLAARGRGSSLLAKACGAGTRPLTVLDPFGGYGLDALLLADMGCKVTVIERQPIVWLLLSGFAEQLGLAVSTACDDGRRWLRDAERAWDVIYLDPMFPARRKAALPNRGLQHLQDLSIAAEVDVDACLSDARARARRVVLKRRRRDPACGKPAHQLKGHSVRFDVYV